jgi:hypothetical protein
MNRFDRKVVQLSILLPAGFTTILALANAAAGGQFGH